MPIGSDEDSAPLSARLFAGYPELAYAIAQRADRLPPNIEVDEFFFQAGTRLRVAAAQRNYISANYTQALRYVIDRGVNVVAQLVARRAGGLASVVADRSDHRNPGCQGFHEGFSVGVLGFDI